MTNTQNELYNSKEFWQERFVDQKFYIIGLWNKRFQWNGRRDQLLKSAKEILQVIEERLNQFS